MKLLKEFSLLVFILSIVLIAISYTNIYFYNAFERYEVYNSLSNLSKVEANNKFDEILYYLRLPWQSEIDREFFSNEDYLHMVDVKNLYIGTHLVAIISLIGLFITRRVNWLSIRNTFITYIIIGSAALIVSLDFNYFFILFHKLLFPFNDYWILNPQTSNLIKYLPEMIFLELFTIIIIISLTTRSLIALLNKKYRAKHSLDA